LYLYRYLVDQLEHMAAAAFVLARNYTLMSAQSWKDGFYMGAVQSIYERLDAQKRETVATQDACKALVIVKEAELNKAMHKFHPNTRVAPVKSVKLDSGYKQGAEAGRKVALNKAIEA
jgi:hypothetical protein